MIFAQLDREFRSLDGPDQGLVYGTMLAAAVALVHMVLYSSWYVEDAAITFAFARHLAAGWGPVVYPGGEYVEGFSNPTWTLALTVLSAIGLSPFFAAKLLGAGFGLGALALSTVWARELIPEEQRPYALIAPFTLAVSPSFAMWCVAGLENPLLSLLVAGAAIRGLGEVRTRDLPISGVLWGMVAITRPEAPLYAALGGLVTGAAVLRARGVGGAAAYTAGWLGLFLLPFGLWHSWRYWTFAWEFPNTYYAKVHDDSFAPFAWEKAGWKYIRAWALLTGQGFLAPLYVVGQSGIAGHRGAVGATLGGIAMVLVLPGVDWVQNLPLTPDVDPDWLVTARTGWLFGVAAVAPFLGLGRKADDARVLAWVLFGAALFFGLYSGGDWMNGFRWPSLMIVPFAVLFADAVAQVALALAPLHRVWVSRLAFVGTVGVTAVLGVVQSAGLVSRPETSPHDVRIRVLHMQEVADRLGLERPSAGEIDMGAHLWWSGFELTDLAGLLDVPVGHHDWEPTFMAEYVLEERRPDFMHVHSFWARRTQLQHHAGFTQHWVEIPAYPISATRQHPGNHVRRDLLLHDSWSEAGLDERLGVSLGSLAVLEGVAVRSLMVAPGTDAVVELAVRKTRPAREVRLTLFAYAEGEVVSSADAPIAYDWILQGQMKRSEIATTRIQLPIPAETAPGTLSLGVVAWTTGRGARPLSVPDPVEDPVFAANEVHVGSLDVRPESELRGEVDARMSALEDAAEAGRCAEADVLARQVRDLGLAAVDEVEAAVRARDGVRARCWAVLAEERADADAIHWAIRLDPGDPDVLAAGRRLADRWEADAGLALAEEDLDAAYAALRDALRADPTRAWVRRRAETLRDRRLGIGEFAPSADPADGAESD